LAARVLLVAVHGYRKGLSPLLPPSCRFTPSCSAYAEDALRAWPLPAALRMAAWRVLRCHPWSRGGHDPVPVPPSLPPALS
jgi:putative membrane protein insertion efficiency factor